MSPKAAPTKRDICGTMAGWNAHARAKERNCMPCKVSHTEYMRDWRHRTGRSSSRLYTDEEIAAIRSEAKAGALREASDAYPLETAYGGAEHAVLWLKERAAYIEAVPTGAASVIPEQEPNHGPINH